MRYELLLQTMTPGEPYPEAAVDALLEGRRVASRPDGLRVWPLLGGDVEVGVLREGGRVVATELRVPLSGRPDLVREVVAEAAALAAEAGARLVDPQLGRPLSGNDAGPVVEQYLRTAWYAGHVADLSEALGASGPMAAHEPRSSLPSGSFLLAAMGMLFVLYLVVDAMVSRLGGH